MTQAEPFGEERWAGESTYSRYAVRRKGGRILSASSCHSAIDASNVMQPLYAMKMYRIRATCFA